MDSDSDDGQAYTTTAVTLGYASTTPTSDSFSQLGGYPTWPDPCETPDGRLSTCSTCNGHLSLLLQLNTDLPDRFHGHERRLYIFICRNKPCRRKAGSIRAIRGTKAKASKAAVKKQSNAPQSQQSGNNGRKPDQPIHSPDIMNGLGTSIFGKANPFSANTGTSNAELNTQSEDAANPCPDITISSPDLEQTAPYQTATPQSDEISSLPTTFADKISLATEHSPDKNILQPIPWPNDAVSAKAYPRYHLDAGFESLEPSGNDISTTKYDMDIDSGSGGLDDRSDDRDAFESTIDKTFQTFADRLAQNPDQVLRYEFGGQPLLYAKSDSVGALFQTANTMSNDNERSSQKAHAKVKVVSTPSQSRISCCPRCRSPRQFEVQLVPGAITELEINEISLDGMDWGTIIVCVCAADCSDPSPRDRSRKWHWMEEWVGVQWEEAGQPQQQKIK